MPFDLAALRDRLQQALGPEFTPGSLLGEGGFAAVFRVRDNTLGRDVAVKVLDPALAPSPTLAERFVREAQTIARLEHPHIVPIYEVGKQGGLLYIVMRCVDGPSLRQLLARQQRLAVRDAASIARQVADALAYAHTEGVVHRDVKPDNILLDRHGHVLVTDFGIAKAARAVAAGGEQLTVEGMIIGTPQYMSPEQAAGEAVDGRSDVYSLGIVLYQLLAGTPPFDGPSSAAILAKQLTAQPTPITKVRDDVPGPLVGVLDRMLAKDPGARFQTAAAASQALVAALPTAARDTVRLPRHHRIMGMAVKSLVGIGMGGCLLVLAFAAGAVFVLWNVLSDRPRFAVSAPVSDSLAGALRAAGALAVDDTAEYVFAPDGRLDSLILVVGRRWVSVAGPGSVRRYGRDSLHYDADVELKRGLRGTFVLVAPGAPPDTVYADLSPRATFVLLQAVERLLAPDSGVVRLPRADARSGAPVRIDRR
jgi:serine/threonine-protein kinase